MQVPGQPSVHIPLEANIESFHTFRHVTHTDERLCHSKLTHKFLKSDVQCYERL